MYYIGYVTANIVKPLQVVINEINGYIDEKIEISI